MTLLRFTLSEEGVGILRDALACLSKFSEEVSFEAKKDKLLLTALNSSKSAYAFFSFATNRFFSKYHYDGTGQARDKFFCKLYNRALFSLFRARSGDPLHTGEKDTTIDRCDVAVEDDDGKKSRFIVKITFRNGMTTKYRLPFEVGVPVHAKFDKEEASNHWRMSSRVLRQLLDHFGPGIDLLDIHAEDDQVVNLTCYTEKVSNGDEVLKKPLHTSIAVERDEFLEFEVEEEKLHIVISVKDFRAVIQHAAMLGGDVSAQFSAPARPMQLSYEGDGIRCEFLLMTVGERGAPAQRAKKARPNARAPRQEQLEAASSRATSHAPTPAPQPPSLPPPLPRQDTMPALRPGLPRPSQRPPPTFDNDSLFVPQDNDQWEPVNVDEDEDEEEDARLGWDPNAQPSASAMNMRSVIASRSGQEASTGEASDHQANESQLDPTQRLSEVRKFGLFND